MSGIWCPVRHLSLVVLALTIIGPVPAAAQSEPGQGTSTFVVMLGGVRVGTERVTLTRSAGGWLISASGQLAPPFSLQTNRFEVRYALDWHPQTLTIEGLASNRQLTMTTTFGLTTATTDLVRDGQRTSISHTVSPRTIVLPTNFFASYEALAARLAASAVGTRLAVFMVPGAEIGAVVERITPRFITTPDRDIDIRQFDLTLGTPAGPIAVEVWTDSRNRLARVIIPVTGMAAIRDDLATVMAREDTVRNPGDQDAFIPGNGFNLAATFTPPAARGAARARPPVVILVPGAGPEDRDHTVFGVSVFGRLAGALAEAGYFVVRYDKRGVGQSGGRVESARVTDYADDVKRIVRWVRDRDDVDRDRIAIVGYDEGSAVALTAADIEGRVKAVVLLGATSQTGQQATLAKHERSLARAAITEVDRQERRAMQQRLIDAAMTGTGWDAVPEEVRKQADTAWFSTWLRFDPERAVSKMGQPLLIVHGALDKEVPPEEATRLEEFALQKKNRRVEKRIVPGANHLLVSAETGEVDEYAGLDGKALAADVVTALVDWLRTAFDKK